jgi:AcrR family transcriptional regulator
LFGKGGAVAKKEDRRVQRTQRLLREALVALIREKGFEALSVQEIIDRANVGRATFYAHFDNKEDLLASGFDELRASLKERQKDALAHGSGLFGLLIWWLNEKKGLSVEYLNALFRRIVIPAMKTAWR